MTAIRSSLANSFETTLSAEMGPNDLTAAVASIGILTTPCWLVIEMDSDSQREYIYFDGTFGGSSFVASNISFRYQQGSAAGSNLTHPIGSTVRSAAVAGLFGDLHDRIDGIDHAGLQGLTADDHTQYVLADGTRDFSAPIVVGEPSLSTQAATKSYVDAQVAGGIPAGVITAYGGSSAPGGYLMCDGAEISRATYNDLWLAISTNYGNGNGTTTFDLPDLRQKFPLGKATSGTGSSLGDTGGAIDHDHSFPSHSHTMGTHTHSVDPASTQSDVESSVTITVSGADGTDAGTGNNVDNYNYVVSGSKASHIHTATTVPAHSHWTNIASFTSGATDPGDTNSASAGDTGTENPPFLAVNYIIKT